MEGTELCLPPDLPYPVTISSLALQPSSQVTRGIRLLTYSYAFKSAATGNCETRFGTWESTTDGTLHSWKVNRGDIISQPKAVVVINEPCKHPVQIGGLCAVCGKDITEYVALYKFFINISSLYAVTISSKDQTIWALLMPLEPPSK